MKTEQQQINELSGWVFKLDLKVESIQRFIEQNTEANPLTLAEFSNKDESMGVKGNEKKLESRMSNPLRPSHYGGGDNDPYEVIKVIEAWNLGFFLGNTIKYVARAGLKNPAKEIEDLEKAKQYIDFRIKELGNGKG